MSSARYLRHALRSLQLLLGIQGPRCGFQAAITQQNAMEGVLLTSLSLIVLCELMGDFCQRLTSVPIPGPVIGMALLLIALILRGGLPETLDRAAMSLLSYLPMLFIPAGVGIMAHFDLIKAHWLALTAGVVCSSVLAVAVTALTMRGVERVQENIRKGPSWLRLSSSR